jgi:hypothetical protein
MEEKAGADNTSGTPAVVTAGIPAGYEPLSVPDEPEVDELRRHIQWTEAPMRPYAIR